MTEAFRNTPAGVESAFYDAFSRLDICDGPGLSRAFSEFQPDAVVHLAAESHVDRSIDGPADFVQTNLVCTFTMLEASLAWVREREPERVRVVLGSTGEVSPIPIYTRFLFSKRISVSPVRLNQMTNAAATYIDMFIQNPSVIIYSPPS